MTPASGATTKLPEFECRGASRELAVIVHGFNTTRESLKHVRTAVADARKDADIFMPTFDSGRFSLEDPDEIADRIARRIENYHVAAHYERIVLIGHSLGALLVRKAYVLACGENLDAPFASQFGGRPVARWAAPVERIILMAAMNRGWSISHHLSRTNAILWTLGTWLAFFVELVRRRKPLIMTIHRGASFVTQLRIQWLSMVRHVRDPGKEGTATAQTVQLLGTVDDFVAPMDNIDLTTGQRFIYLDVPESGHVNVVEMDPATPVGRTRNEVFLDVLQSDPTELKKRSVLPEDCGMREPDPSVTDVIFVMHGIRDVGYWTQRIARCVKRVGDGEGRRFAMVTSSYGYFAMGPFLLSIQRQEKVRWLMDQYTEALAKYPDADFSYVGHSNGTYLLARAVRDNPSCHFKHVVFAGSVVPSRYDWQSLLPRAPSGAPGNVLEEPRVQKVLNYVATCDLVVAIFPKAFEMLRLADIGSAGHDGFRTVDPRVPQVRCVCGGHGAALREENWDDIANFIVNGVVPDRFHNPQSQVAKLLGRFAPLIWLAIILVVAAVLVGLVLFVPNPTVRALAVVAYLGFVWWFLTKV